MTKIAMQLEHIKRGQIDAFSLDDATLDAIKIWYEKFCLGEFQLTQATDLMYELFVRENLDFYPIDEFKRISNETCRKYQIHDKLFLQMLSEFRQLVYNSDAP